MREFAKFGCGFWTSQAIQSLSDTGKLLAAYLISGPHSNQAGVYRLPDGYVSADLGWGFERVREGFEELSRNGFAQRCSSTFWVVIRKALKHQPPDNINQAKHISALIEQVPATATIWPVINDAISEYMTGTYGEVGERLRKLVAERLANPSARVSEPTATNEKEKRREGEEKDILAPSAALLDAGDQPATAFTIPLNDGTEFQLTQRQLDELAALYPAVDVPQAIRNMRGWSISHPRERKTKSGVMKFITGWLAKDQNRGGARRTEAPIGRREAIEARNIEAAREFVGEAGNA